MTSAFVSPPIIALLRRAFRCAGAQNHALVAVPVLFRDCRCGQAGTASTSTSARRACCQRAQATPGRWMRARDCGAECAAGGIGRSLWQPVHTCVTIWTASIRAICVQRRGRRLPPRLRPSTPKLCDFSDSGMRLRRCLLWCAIHVYAWRVRTAVGRTHGDERGVRRVSLRELFDQRPACGAEFSGRRLPGCGGVRPDRLRVQWCRMLMAMCSSRTTRTLVCACCA